MVEPGSAALRAVAFGTGETLIIMFLVFAIAVGEVVSHGIAVVRRVCVAGSAVGVGVWTAACVAIVTTSCALIRL